MTQVIGCGGNNLTEPKKNLTDKQVVDKFDSFIQMFPTEDLSVLYDKAGGSGLKPGDKGTWTISSYLDTKNSQEDTSFGVVLWFNKNTHITKGNLISRKDDERSEYPIYYNDGEINLVDESNVPIEIKNKLAGFRLLYEFIEIDKKYLENLKLVDTNYNSNAPIFDALYRLEPSDENIARIKEVYPMLIIDENNCTLELNGNGIPWNTKSGLDLSIVLDKDYNTYLSAAMRFGSSSVLEEKSDE
ncbi:MAG: Csa1 family protein [Sarcina sp.]